MTEKGPRPGPARPPGLLPAEGAAGRRSTRAVSAEGACCFAKTVCYDGRVLILPTSKYQPSRAALAGGDSCSSSFNHTTSMSDMRQSHEFDKELASFNRDRMCSLAPAHGAPRVVSSATSSIHYGKMSPRQRRYAKLPNQKPKAAKSVGAPNRVTGYVAATTPLSHEQHGPPRRDVRKCRKEIFITPDNLSILGVYTSDALCSTHGRDFVVPQMDRAASAPGSLRSDGEATSTISSMERENSASWRWHRRNRDRLDEMFEAPRICYMSSGQ